MRWIDHEERIPAELLMEGSVDAARASESFAGNRQDLNAVVTAVATQIAVDAPDGGCPGRGSSNKVAFVAAVELDKGRPQRVRFDPVNGFSFAALTPWAKCAIAP
ncbi:MAG: hypothetical protein K2Y13_16550 [Burkholderiaceae bacterium]|nr:hypothetical protein [Burkholderiaceae bacterium]